MNDAYKLNSDKRWQNRIVGYDNVPPDQLLANPANFRVHPKRQQDALTGSLNELGWLQDVIVNRVTDHVLDGHLRVQLALRNGEPTVPVKYIEISEAEEKLALAVFDPITYMAETDSAILDTLLQEVNTGESALQELLAELAEDAGLYGDTKTDVDAEPQIDRAEELRQKWGVSSGDLWQLGEHRLVCGDCTDADVVARVMGGASCQSLIFDPPWDIAFDVPTGEWNSILAFTDGRRAGDVVRLLGAPTWVFVWDCVTSWYAPNRPLQRHKSCFWYGDINNFRLDGAHYGESDQAKTVTNTRGTYRYEPDPRGKHLSDVFQKQITNLDEDDYHKHQKPADWFRLLIGDCTAGNIYDPFMASGTTLVACQQLGRRGFGCEIDPAMVAVVLERMSEMGLSPVLVS